MRLGLKILNTGAQANSFKQVSFIRVASGETTTLYFQLVDQDQNGLRYIPAAGATVQVEILRSSQVVPGDSGLRETVDRTITRAAAVAFTGDNSIWKLPLTATDTETMISNSIKVTVTEGSEKKIAWAEAAIKMIDHQES